MKLSVFTDIHGNLEAFARVLEEIEAEKPDRIISLGDNIGYGPDPEPVMELLRQFDIKSVLGNHELAIVNRRFIKWFNPLAQIAVNYTQKHLSDTSVDLIKTYEKCLVSENMRFVHGSPLSSVSIYLFQLSDSKLMSILDKMEEDICFTGHTHDLGLIEYDGDTLVRKHLGEGVIHLDRDKKYIVNTGSVGQPRDGDNRAKFVLFDTEDYSLDIRFVTYDYKKTAKKIVDAGIPDVYAKKLYP